MNATVNRKCIPLTVTRTIISVNAATVAKINFHQWMQQHLYIKCYVYNYAIRITKCCQDNEFPLPPYLEYFSLLQDYNIIQHVLIYTFWCTAIIRHHRTSNPTCRRCRRGSCRAGWPDSWLRLRRGSGRVYSTRNVDNHTSFRMYEGRPSGQMFERMRGPLANLQSDPVPALQSSPTPRYAVRAKDDVWRFASEGPAKLKKWARDGRRACRPLAGTNWWTDSLLATGVVGDIGGHKKKKRLRKSVEVLLLADPAPRTLPSFTLSPPLHTSNFPKNSIQSQTLSSKIAEQLSKSRYGLDPATQISGFSN